MARHLYKWSAKTDVWLTPPDVVELVRAFYEGPPDFDPASSPVGNTFLGARRYLTRRHNGLEYPWACAGENVWCNPPGGTFKTGVGRPQSVAGMFWARLMEELERPEEQRFNQALFLGFNIEFLRSSQNYGAHPASDFPFVLPRSRFRYFNRKLVRSTAPSHASVIIYVPGQVDDRERFFEVFGSLGAVVNPS